MARWPLPEQQAGLVLPVRDRRGDALLVEAGERAHVAGGAVVDHEHAHRPVGLRLQDEAALELEHRAEQHGEHDGLADELRDRRGVVVLRQDRVDRRAEPHHASAHVKRRDLERQDAVVGRGRRGLAHRDGDMGIGHGRLDIMSSATNVTPGPCADAATLRAVTGPRPGTRRECPSARAGGSRPRRTPPIADRRSPRR